MLTIVLSCLLALSVIGNVLLMGRKNYLLEGLSITNERLQTAFDLLWIEAEKHGATDKSEFTQKLVMLSNVHPNMRPMLAEQIQVVPKDTTSKGGIGFH